MCTIFKNEKPQIQRHQAKLDIQKWDILSEDGMKAQAAVETATRNGRRKRTKKQRKMPIRKKDRGSRGCPPFFSTDEV